MLLKWDLVCIAEVGFRCCSSGIYYVLLKWDFDVVQVGFGYVLMMWDFDVVQVGFGVYC